MMTNGWQTIALGNLLTRIKNEVTVDDFERYQRLTIRLYNKGIDIRDELLGHEIGTKKQFVVRCGQFLLSKIDAMNGAFGIVPDSVSRGIITGNFWAYDVDEESLLPKYFNYLTHTPTFQEFCIRSSSGTTHRKYLQEDLFLGMEIPLPPLTEQRRIVARVESLAARVDEAQRLREEADHQTSSIIASKSLDVFSQVKRDFPIRTFGEYSPHVTSGPRYWRDRYSKEGSRFYRAQDIGPYGNILNGTKAYVIPPESDYGKTAFLAVGDLMIVITGATVGRVSVFTNDLEPGYVSQHVAICRLQQNAILPKYALWWLLSPDGETQLLGQRYGQGKPGLNLTNIRSIEIPVPPLDEQRRIVVYLDGLQAKVNALRELQSASGEELSALMPSVLDKAFKGEL